MKINKLARSCLHAKARSFMCNNLGNRGEHFEPPADLLVGITWPF